MYIFILHNKVKTGSYADALFRLLVEYLNKTGFIVTECEDFNDVKKTVTGTDKSALIWHSEKKAISFFKGLSLRTLLKKKRFDRYIEITDSKFTSAGLFQLVISNQVRNSASAGFLPNIFFAVDSETAKQKAIEQNQNTSGSVKVIPLAAEHTYQPITWSEQQSVKMQYTQGREYFLTFAEGKTEVSFTEMLKAFSTFKKWQLSNMKLLVTRRLSFTETEEWKEKITTYKFREDVMLLEKSNDAELAKIVAGAYAFIHTPVADNDILPLLQAMQCETCCASFATGSAKEYAGEAVIIIEPGNYEQLSETMIRLYKDEALRSRLIAKGKEATDHFTKEKTFIALGKALQLPVH